MGKNKGGKANGHINDDLKLEKPKAAAGGSNLSLWIVILVITVGTAGGLHFIIEQVGNNNAALTKKIAAFKEELSSFKEFQAQSANIGDKLDLLNSIQEEIASFKAQVVATGEGASKEIAAVTAQVQDVVGSLDGIAKQQASSAAEAVKADVAGEISQLAAELAGVKTAAVQSSKDVSTLVKELAGLADSMAPSSALKTVSSEVSALKTLLAEVSGTVSTLKKELAASIERMDQSTYSLGGHLKVAKEEIQSVKEMVGPLNDVIMSIQNIKQEEPEEEEPEVVEPEEPAEPEPVVEAEPEVEEPAAVEEPAEVAEPEVAEVEEPAAEESEEAAVEEPEATEEE